MSDQQKPRSGPTMEWIVIGSLWIYAILVCVLRGFGLLSTGGVLIFGSLPCFCAGVWYGYLYFISRNVRYDWGLICAGLGWMAAGITFMTVGVGVHRDVSLGFAWVWGWLAVLLIIAGSVVGWFSIQTEPEEEGTRDVP